MVLTAVYLINKLPSTDIEKKTLFELLYGKRPGSNYLKVYGCLAFASTLTCSRLKHDARARRCIFIGYPFAIKGYRLLDEETSKIFISRNVIFHETIFSCRERKESGETYSS